MLHTPSVRDLIASYTRDALVGDMWRVIRHAGPLRSISVDVTRRCNLRCVGCYYFAENMDQVAEATGDDFDTFVSSEVERGTNFVTVIGGEPSLVIDRLQLLAQHFHLMIVTNGLRKIPREGLEEAAIAVSVWGDRATDRHLRGRDRMDVFERAVANWRGDPRVVWYITLPPNPPAETEEVVQTCTGLDQLVGFNYYGDLHGIGGHFDHRQGFDGARAFVDRMIQQYPRHVAFTSYLNGVISSGRMHGLRWGHDVCASISADHVKNAARIRNGNPYSPHFRAYNADLQTTRRCCVGENRDCASCYDVWAHMSWIALSLEKHLQSAEDFADWLATVFMFYGAARLLNPEWFRATLPLVHARLRFLTV